jgi:hypothetical protein
MELTEAELFEAIRRDRMVLKRGVRQIARERGIAGVCTAPDALPMRAAVAWIPPMTKMGEVVELKTVQE